MRCPICAGNMEESDSEYICSSCGAAFGLEYLGVYLEGIDDRFDDGFEPAVWKQEYGSRLEKYRWEQ